MAKLLNKVEQNALAIAAQKGNIAAQNKLVMCNMGLVYTAANALVRFDGANREDLVNEGVIGLIESIPDYDVSKGVKFTTFATHRIRMRMLNRCMSDHRLVKIGTSEAQRKLFWNLNKETAKCKAEGIEPTAETLAERIGNVTADHVREMQIRLGAAGEDSLASITGEGQTLFDTIADTSTPDPETYTTEKLERAWMLNTMIAFEQTIKNPVHLAIWNRRIASESPDTLQAIGTDEGVTRERVRQIEVDLRERFEIFARKRA